ncbi:hypothetical protein BH11PSE11_BH11PSE11_27660 [soil metagenome]
MKRIRSTGLFACLWVALTLAAFARSTDTGIAQALLVTVFWAAVHGAGLWYAHGHHAAPAKKLTDGIALFGLCVFVFELLTGSLAHGLMSLLLWLQAAKNPALSTRRDAYFALVISLILVVFGASETRTTGFLLVIVAYGLSALGVLVYCHQQGSLDQGSQTETQTSTQGLALSIPHLTVVAGSVFAIALVWYLLVPRPAPIHFGAVSTRGGQDYFHGEWEREAARKNSGRGGAENFSEPSRDANKSESERPGQQPQPTDEIYITRRGDTQHAKGQGEQGAAAANGIVLYVQSDRALYLRERTYDRFVDNRWSTSNSQTRKLLPERGTFKLPSPPNGEKIQYTVQVVSDIKNNIPLSAHASSVELKASVIGQGDDGAVYLPRRIKAGLRYGAAAILPLDSTRPSARDVPASLANYLQLPPGYSSRIGELSRQVTSATASRFDKALALETHLRTTYAYSVESIFTSQSVTPLEEFLFETRRGHCEFFASAMAIMLREIGIPSRLVNGYLAHGFNPVTGLYEVRAFDRHAWVEAYLDGMGWVSFEPTAAYPIPQRQQQSGTTLADLKTYAEMLAEQERLRGEEGTLQTVSGTLKALTDAWYLLLFRIEAWSDALQAWIGANAVWITIALVCVIAAAFGAWHFRVRLLWIRAQLAIRLAKVDDIPIVAFRQLEKVATARMLGKAESETVDEYVKRLERAYVGMQVELRVLRRAFNARRYDMRTLKASDKEILLRAFHVIGRAFQVR